MPGKKQVPPLLVVVSGPSGVGKDAVLTGMKKAGSPLYYAVTMTTRAQRAGEQDGVDYRFVSQSRFEQMIKDGELLEWANVYGNLYGVPKTGIREAMAGGRDAIVKVDVQGAATIKRSHPEAVFVFLAPPSMDELEKRLRQRKTESGVDLALRLEAAKEEMKSAGMFDYVVVNHQDDIASAVSQIECIVVAEKCRVKPASIDL